MNIQHAGKMKSWQKSTRDTGQERVNVRKPREKLCLMLADVGNSHVLLQGSQLSVVIGVDGKYCDIF